MNFIYRYDSPIGPLTMESDGESLIGLWFDGQKFNEAREDKYLPVFSATARWLDLYFGGVQPDFTPPISLTA